MVGRGREWRGERESMFAFTTAVTDAVLILEVKLILYDSTSSLELIQKITNGLKETSLQN